MSLLLLLLLFSVSSLAINPLKLYPDDSASMEVLYRSMLHYDDTLAIGSNEALDMFKQNVNSHIMTNGLFNPRFGNYAWHFISDSNNNPLKHLKRSIIGNQNGPTHELFDYKANPSSISFLGSTPTSEFPARVSVVFIAGTSKNNLPFIEFRFLASNKHFKQDDVLNLLNSITNQFYEEFNTIQALHKNLSLPKWKINAVKSSSNASYKQKTIYYEFTQRHQIVDIEKQIALLLPALFKHLK